MPRAIDLSTVSPERAAEILRCREAKKREYERKRDILLARNREWRNANPGKCTESARQWRERNRERHEANKKAWYEANRDTVLARQAQRERDLSTPGVLRSIFGRANDGLTARDCPDEMLELIKIHTLVKRELKARKGAAK